jgi:hypothetical protein
MSDIYDWLPGAATVATVLILIVAVAVAVLEPKFEAETYTRLTGKKVTYWDAVFCDLRIQEQVKEK